MMMMMMGIKVRDFDLEMNGATALVQKIIAADPRSISRFEVTFVFPFLTDKIIRKMLEHSTITRPVYYSLHPDIEKIISFNW